MKSRDIKNSDSWKQASEDWLHAHENFPIEPELGKKLSELCKEVADKLETNSDFDVNKYIIKTTKKLCKLFCKK